jgi:hypothetical protein
MNHETETIMSKAVAEKVTTASLVASNDNLPAHLQLVNNGVGRGNENVGANVVIPRIKLLQKNV